MRYHFDGQFDFIGASASLHGVVSRKLLPAAK